MKKRFYFASANTSLGFINYFDNICDKENSFTYIIKGSSGCGKSTLMKKIANHFENKNFDIEYYYCSSDPNSLDAIRLTNYNICIVDGTSPHTIDSKMPEIYDKIINLGEYIDFNVYNYKTEIDTLYKKKKQNYSIIYNYLKSIGNIENINLMSYFGYYNKELENYVFNFISKSYKPHFIKKLFLQSLDTFGINDFTNKNDFIIKKLPINKYQFAEFVNNIKPNLLNNLCDITFFNDIYIPQNVVSFLINDKILFTYESNFNNNNTSIINSIQNLASNTLLETRKLHFKLEEYYSKFINYKKLDKVYSYLIKDIEKRIQIK